MQTHTTVQPGLQSFKSCVHSTHLHYNNIYDKFVTQLSEVY